MMQFHNILKETPKYESCIEDSPSHWQMFHHKTDIYCEHQSYQGRGEILSLKSLKLWQNVIILKSVKGGNQKKRHLLRLLCTHSIILWQYHKIQLKIYFWNVQNLYLIIFKQHLNLSRILKVKFWQHVLILSGYF